MDLLKMRSKIREGEQESKRKMLKQQHTVDSKSSSISHLCIDTIHNYPLNYYSSFKHFTMGIYAYKQRQ